MTFVVLSLRATRVLVEHVRIHGMVAQLKVALTSGAAGGEQFMKLGETLRAHVRLEENHLFPLIERTVPEDDFSAVVFAERTRGLPAAEPSEAKFPDEGSMARAADAEAKR